MRAGPRFFVRGLAPPVVFVVLVGRRSSVAGLLFMKCNLPRTVHTIGHSTRPMTAFVDLLEAHRIRLLVDVRRWPVSRRFSHFNRERLDMALKNCGIGYIWRGDLGGFRKPSGESNNTGWKTKTFRAYADFMLTQEFERILKELAMQVAQNRSVLMCAEAVPWRCHRQLLADAFLVRGFSVHHIMEDGCYEHRLPAFARLDGENIFYG